MPDVGNLWRSHERKMLRHEACQRAAENVVRELVGDLPENNDAKSPAKYCNSSRRHLWHAIGGKMWPCWRVEAHVIAGKRHLVCFSAW